MSERKGFRRHHNNKGYRQIKLGNTCKQVEAIAKRLGIPYGSKITPEKEKSL